MAPGSLTGEATEIFQEGLRLPAIKLISKGETIRSVMDIIKVNSRMPDLLRRRHVGGDRRRCASARRRLVELAEKYGVETFESAMSSFMDFGEQVSLRRARASCPRARSSCRKSRMTAASST